MRNNLDAGRPAIIVLPRIEAEQTLPGPDGACISITNPKQSPAALLEWPHLLRLGFHDVDEDVANYKAMSREQARQVLEFAKAHQNAPLMVHCEFGFSRSVAVGLFLSTWLKRPLRVQVIGPNPGVILRLCEAGWRMGFLTRDWRLLMLSLTGPAFMQQLAKFIETPVSNKAARIEN